MNALGAAPALTVHRSRKLIPEFDLHRPKTAAQAVATKAARGPGAVFMAGGIDVVNRMKFGVPVTDVIHLGGIAGLDEITETPDGLRLGALVTHDRLATSPLVARHLPTLTQTWDDVANIRVRCKGTLGGNLMAGDPAYDFALAAMAANARLEFLGTAGITRIVAASEPGALDSDALLLAITIPSAADLRLFFDRSLRPVVTLALGLDIADGRVAGGRIAIGCAYTKPVAARLPLDAPTTRAELKQRADTLAHEVASTLPEPLGDPVASSSYRRRMIEVLLRRNLAAAA
jgi:aerobic carbon-monoxide dehydrogenase medium subunit